MGKAKGQIQNSPFEETRSHKRRRCFISFYDKHSFSAWEGAEKISEEISLKCRMMVIRLSVKIYIRSDCVNRNVSEQRDSIRIKITHRHRKANERRKSEIGADRSKLAVVRADIHVPLAGPREQPTIGRSMAT